MITVNEKTSFWAKSQGIAPVVATAEKSISQQWVREEAPLDLEEEERKLIDQFVAPVSQNVSRRVDVRTEPTISSTSRGSVSELRDRSL